LIKKLFAVGVLAIGLAHPVAAQQAAPLSCASWNANHRYGQQHTSDGLIQEVWISGFIAALEEEWIAHGIHDTSRQADIEAEIAAVSVYCGRFPGGNLAIGARDAAESLYPKKATRPVTREKGGVSNQNVPCLNNLCQ
jgi:hypothetical protein